MAVFVFTSTYVSTSNNVYSSDWSSFDLTGMVDLPIATHTAKDLGWTQQDTVGSLSIDFKGLGLLPVLSGNKLTDVTGGTIKGLHSVVVEAGPNGGTTEGTISKLNLNAAHLFDMVFVQDWTGVTNYILQGNDKMTGCDLSEVISGGAGSDTISGGLGADILLGGSGNDVLLGGGCNDVLYGGMGFDTLRGGSGADQFVFQSGQFAKFFTKIDDFQHGSDKIALSHSAFAHLGLKGALNPAFFANGVATSDAQVIIYDQQTGDIGFRDHGFDLDTSWTFAQLAPGTVLAAGDILVL